MKKSLILLTLVISFLIVLSSQFISGYKGGGGQQDYHSICQSGNCIRLDGGGNYNCDNHNVGTTNNPCCSRSYCSGLTKKLLSIIFVDPVIDLVFDCSFCTS